MLLWFVSFPLFVVVASFRPSLIISRKPLPACQKILQQRLLPSPASAVPSSAPRPTTPNHYSTLGRHFTTGAAPSSALGTAGVVAAGGNYPGAPAAAGFSSSSLGVAGSTLGPAGAAIGTGHSSLAGYGTNNGGPGSVSAAALGGSAHNLHSAASLNTNGALAARGTCVTKLFFITDCSAGPPPVLCGARAKR